MANSDPYRPLGSIDSDGFLTAQGDFSDPVASTPLSEVALSLDDVRIAVNVRREIPGWLICGEVRGQSRFA